MAGKMTQIKTARGTMAVRQHEQVDDHRPPLLLIHGAGGVYRDWHVQQRRKMPIATITPDLNGHGNSDGKGHETVDAYAQDMIALLDALDVPQAVAVGHSMGGAIAQTLARSYPKRIAGIGLVGTGALLQVNEAIINGILNDTQAIAERIIQWAWGKDVPEEWRVLGLQRLLAIDPQVTYHDYVACNNFDYRQELPHIQQPALIIGGRADKMVRFALSEALHAGLPNSELVAFDCGHMIPLEEAQAVADALQDWYGRHFVAAS